MKISYVSSCDFLVIGAGGAGIKAAIKAAEAGADVLLVNKFKVGCSGSTFYPRLQEWGMNSITNPDLGDSEDQFYKEILEGAQGALDPAVARTLVEQCTPVRLELERDYGLKWRIDPVTGRFASVVPCFGRTERSGSCSMASFKQAMWQHMMRAGVRIRTQINIVSLVIHDGRCCGALGFDERDELVWFRAKAVFLGTGGADAIYKYSLATPDQTGDGYVMALNAGAELMNLEFIQFIPGITWPVKKFLFQEKPLDTMPEITNRDGADILSMYLPAGVSREACLTERAKHGPYSTVGEGKYLDIAMYEQWRAGKAFDDGGFLIRYAPEVAQDPRHFIQFALHWLNMYGIDPIKQGMHILPHAQCFNGGVRINSKAETSIPGLYAGGEAAGGPHGADRMGGNALAASQVFGGIAGVNAAQYVKKEQFAEIPEKQLLDSLMVGYSAGTGRKTDIAAGIQEIRDAMWMDAAIARSAARCQSARQRIDAVAETFDAAAHFEARDDIRGTLGLHSYIELGRAMLAVMEARTESRGPHFRLDYPEKDSAQNGFITIRRDGDGFALTLHRTEV